MSATLQLVAELQFYVTNETVVCPHHGVNFAFLMAVNISNGNFMKFDAV
jgi:hypothetical protein